MTDQRAPIKRILVGSAEMALYGGANLIRPAFGLLALPLYAWIFTPEDFGVIGIYTAILGLLVIVIPVNGPVYVLWNRARLGDAASARAVSATVQIASLLALAAAGLGIGTWLIFDPSFAPMWITLAAAATAWLTTWIVLDTHVHQADDQAGWFFVVNAAWAIGGPLATVLLAFTVSDDWTARIGGMAIAAAVVAAWSATSLRRRGAVALPVERSDRSGVLRFGLPLLPHTVGLWAASFLDRFVVAAIAGIEAAGIYTVAFSIALGVNAAHDGVSRWFAPKLARWTSEDSEAGLERASLFTAGYAAAAVVTVPVLWIVVSALADLVLPDSYDGVGEFLIWLIIAQALIGIARILTGYLYAAGHTGTQSVITIIVAGVGLGLAVWLVSEYGAIGAAYAAVASSCVRLLLTSVAAWRTGLLRNPLLTQRSQS